MGVFALLAKGWAGWCATYVCINLMSLSCLFTHIDSTPSSFLHFAFTKMAENFYFAITPQFVCPYVYEPELAA